MGWVYGTVRRFGADERGMALVLVSIMLPVIIGFALLAIDMSRVNNLHYDLQRGADALAIAGATELDGRSDSIERSERAIANLVDNSYRFSTDGDPSPVLTNAGVSTRYLRSLPSDDSIAIRAEDIIADEEADASEAVFVEVQVTPVGFSAIFPASFLSSSAENSFNVSASAVAGNAGTVVCDMVPLFICNPFPGESLTEIANSGTFYKKGIKLIVGGSSWGPGNFGFLRPEDAHGYGEPELARDLAQGTVPECVNSRLIYTQTGNLTQKAKSGINTRFDMYDSHFAKTGANWPPAPNIRKGYEYKPKGPNPGTDPCDMRMSTNTTNFQKIPRDATYQSGSAANIGNGDWNYEAYLTANGFSAGDMSAFVDSDGNAYSNTNRPSRYDLYKYEISNGLVDDPSLGNEIGTPQCHASPSTDPNRRLIYAAIVDCNDEDIQDELNGQSGEVPAMGFASFFLTEPVGDDDDIVYAEIVDIDGNRGRGTMENFSREEVQLYR